MPSPLTPTRRRGVQQTGDDEVDLGLLNFVLGQSLEDLQQILHLGVNAEEHHGRVQVQKTPQNLSWEEILKTSTRRNDERLTQEAA